MRIEIHPGEQGGPVEIHLSADDRGHMALFSVLPYGVSIEIATDYHKTAIWHQGPQPWAHLQSKPIQAIQVKG